MENIREHSLIDVWFKNGGQLMHDMMPDAPSTEKVENPKTQQEMAESELVLTIERLLGIIADDKTLAHLRSTFLRDLNRLVDNTVSNLTNTNHQPESEGSSLNICCLLCGVSPIDSFFKTLINQASFDTIEQATIKDTLALAMQPLPLLSDTDIRGTGYRTTPFLLGRYIGAPEPNNEVQRLAKLYSLNILDSDDTESNATLDTLTATFSTLTGMASVVISLVDKDRTWFRSRCNYIATENNRDVSFSAWMLLSPHTNGQAFIVNDAATDPRFAENPLVMGPPHIRFFIGVPIVYDGLLLGSLCGWDFVPRCPESNGIDTLVMIQLRNLSALVSTEFRKMKRRGL
jgi:hypothetical protein